MAADATAAPPTVEEEDNSSHPLLSPTTIKAGSFSLRYKPKSAADARTQEYEQNDTNAELELVTDYESNSRSGTLQKWIQYCQKFSPLPLRILLLALYLASTLSTFWILDSIKDPTLAALVEGDLGKHQPRAKMISFVVVVGIALTVEGMDSLRRRRSTTTTNNNDDEDVNKEIEKSWQDRNLPTNMQSDSMSQWKKMKIVPERIWKHFRMDDSEQNTRSSKISAAAFYIVGSVYIHFFVTVAIALRQHPLFRPNPIFHDVNEVTQLQTSGLDVYPSSEFYSESAVPKSSDVHFTFLGYALYALIESYGSVSITIFWAFANSHLTLEAAEQHYGSIVAVAQAGAIFGSTLSATLGRRQKNHDVEKENDLHVTPMLIFLACGCIGLGMGIMALYGQLFSNPMVQNTSSQRPSSVEECDRPKDISTIDPQQPQSSKGAESNAIGEDLLSGLYLIFRYEYLKLVLAVSVLYEIALTCMHYELNLIGLDRFGVGVSIQDKSTLNDSSTDEGITYIQFMGWYGQTVNVLSLFLSYYAFPRLIQRYGLSTTIRIFPTVLLGVTICAFVIFPHNLPFLFIALSICKALTFSVHDPAEEVLYMPTSDAIKFKAKFWIDVVGQRVAKALGSAVNNYAGSIEGIIKYGSLPSIVASIALWFACYQVGVLFDRLTKSGDIVGLEDGDVTEGLELAAFIEPEKEKDDETANSPLFRDEEELAPPPSLEVGGQI
eukprot:scaffold10711_cov73-Cyclotella_meneghiniana.AAC.5